MKKKNLKGLSREELAAFIEEIGEKSFRTGQIWSWMYLKGVNRFEEMTDISKGLRARLASIATIETLDCEQETGSNRSDTRKFLWRLHDGLHVESVYIPEVKRRTFCISTQVGCAMGCRFCATSTMGLIRSLEPWEIIDQVLGIKRLTGIHPTNIVVMGMGEPFANYDNVMKALCIIHDNNGLGIGHRKITISTAGLVPQIKRYLREKEPYNLAISLNAPYDALRSRIMPVNRKYSVQELIDALRPYANASRKMITFEYVLLHGVNDSDSHAAALKKLLKGMRCKINLIPYNETTAEFKRPSDAQVMGFAEHLKDLHATVTLRLSKGDDISGACGQLCVNRNKSGMH